MIDLHMHSHYSDDGECSPKNLVNQCRMNNILAMSVTDHNCVRGCAQAQEIAAQNGILFLSGIEIDCSFQGVNLHMLGYGIDYRSAVFSSIETDIQKQEILASEERLEKTNMLGFHITRQELEKAAEGKYCKSIWTGEMFAEILLAKPEYAEHPFLAPYRAGGSRSDNPYVNFYWDFYAQGKTCHARLSYPSAKKIIEIIHETGGLAVLAHPGINLRGKEALFDSVTTLGIDGIEAFSSYHCAAQAEYYAKKAFENNLFITCGSDYHGKIKPSIRIGQHGCMIPDAELLRPFRRLCSIPLLRFPRVCSRAPYSRRANAVCTS